jgi:hypothetical protein
MPSSQRDVAKVTDLADATPRRVLAVALDVTKPAQVVIAAISGTIERTPEGSISARRYRHCDASAV